MGHDHYGKGWHNTSSIGTLGSTAAAAKMLSLDEMQTRMALGIGATQASGLACELRHDDQTIPSRQHLPCGA